MKKESKLTHFERAAQLKEMIDSIRFTTKPIESIDRYLEGEEVLMSIYEKQLASFANLLNIKKPERIECYDISHFAGSNSVGSMVVFVNGQAAKDEYRRFKIKTILGVNDPAMMHEVLSRRFRNPWTLPDLIVVDGGKTQLNAGVKAIEEAGLSIPIIGLAKKNEEIHLPNKMSTVCLPESSPGLFLIQRIRDEAHRFAITYHRKLRSKEILTLPKKS
jgi:excinuclease ABC subunit C